MPYVQNALTFTIETIVGLYLIAVILRFLFQLLGVDFRNPISLTIVTFTNPPVRILRRFIPGLYGIDLASAVLILMVAMIKYSLLLSVSGYSINFASVLMLGLGESLNIVIWTLLIAIIIRAILSWFAPSTYHPAVRILDGLSEPVLTPFRKMLPAIGGIDLSPALAILTLNIIQQIAVDPIMDSGKMMLIP